MTSLVNCADSTSNLCIEVQGEIHTWVELNPMSNTKGKGKKKVNFKK